MQPAFRKAKQPGQMPATVYRSGTQSVRDLRKGGPSGIVTVLVGLRWWAPSQGDDKSVWLAAVADMQKCFEVMSEPQRKPELKGTERPTKKRRTEL